ncbi:MAG: M13 family metallopeptidase [Pseudomonadota bacterium]
MFTAVLVGAAACALVGSFTLGEGPAGAQSRSAGHASLQQGLSGKWGVETRLMDKSVKPGDDFFRYVNGLWLDSFEIPPDRTSYGNFHLLGDQSNANVRHILESNELTRSDWDSPAGKVGRLYAVYLNQPEINEKGLDTARSYLDQITSIADQSGLISALSNPDFFSPIEVFVTPDDRLPERYIPQIYLSELILPDREYYLKPDAADPAVQTEYRKLVISVLNELGFVDTDTLADKIWDLETALAKASWDQAASQNPEITYNKISRDDLDNLVAGFEWHTYLKGTGLEDAENFLVYELTPSAEELSRAGLDNLPKDKLGGGVKDALALVLLEDIETWKAYLSARFMMDNASVIHSRLDQSVFRFQGTVLRGVESLRPRWERGIRVTQTSMGEALGAAYVARHFSDKSKTDVEEMAGNIVRAMELRLNSLEWMSDDTRGHALKKLSQLGTKIGYPDEFESYDDLSISESALENSLEAGRYRFRKNLRRFGKPVDRTTWLMPPQRVGAYYYGANNEIVFPAAILQPPFFDPRADAAVNYGAIGAVIGHELSHGFDDLGAKFDGSGRLTDWWAPDDYARFKQLGEALAAQYDQYCPLDNGETCVDGTLGLGENIGDLGGLSLSYRAYKLSLDGKEAPIIDGFTGDQRFFLAYAQMWRFKYREEALRNSLRTDPHSPAQYRVNGVVRNLDAWYEAFGVLPGDNLYLPPDQRIKIW